MIRRRRYAFAVSLLGHGLALLALVYLLQRIVLPPPPPESSVSLVFLPPAPQQVTTASPAAPAATAPPEREQEPPPAAQPEAKAEQGEPAAPPSAAEQPVLVLALPEPDREATAPPIPRPAPVEHPPSRRVAAARPLAAEPARPAIAPAPTPAAASIAPLLPAHPVAGMESDRPPVYPEVARRRGQQGRVVLEVSVSAAGMPVSVRVVQSSGYASLDTAAQTAVERWRFVPATRGGAAVSAVAEVPVRFRLTD
jgi:protein TonB